MNYLYFIAFFVIFLIYIITKRNIVMSSCGDHEKYEWVNFNRDIFYDEVACYAL